MLCYKDKTFCSETKCKNQTCTVRFTEKDRELGTKWWGDANFPLATSDYRDSDLCPGYKK